MNLTAMPDSICKVQFTETQLKTIFKLQAGANDVMSDAWRTSTNDEIPYYRASWVELAESLMHLGFKWWKKEHKDDAAIKIAQEQAMMEIVDVMHFAASDYIRDGEKNPTEMLYPWRNTNAGGRDWQDVPVLEVIEHAIADIISSKQVNWAWVCVLAESFEVTADKLYGMYVGKNVLNLFRTANGQREGTYAKLWDGREDNEYLTDFLNRATANNATFTADELQMYLSERYGHFQGLQLTEMK